MSWASLANSGLRETVEGTGQEGVTDGRQFNSPFPTKRSEGTVYTVDVRSGAEPTGPLRGGGAEKVSGLWGSKTRL